MTLVRTPIIAALAGAAIGAILGLLPAEAGDNAPGAALWPPEPAYEATVIELATLGPAMFPTPRCDLRPCGDWYQRPADPAPVPVPASLLLLTAAIAALLIWKGSNRV
jgi:hypothetical protein